MKTPPRIDQSSAALMARVQALVGESLRRVEEIFAEEISSRSPYVREILDHLAGYRGKRMRPMLVLLSGQACGGDREAHCVLAAAIEMIHTATLVHDDILDDATTRRHVATINSRWTNETSVLLGDYLFTHAFHLTSSLGDAAACRAIGRATNLVCEGEMSQIGERGNLDLSEETYLEIIEGKTAELCAVACELGARHAGASEAVCQSFDGYGRDLGIAFQIADDLLDVVGNEKQTGKTLGSDLEKQKLTLPIIHLLANSQGSQADRVRDLLSRPGPRSREELLPLLATAGSIDYARSRAVDFTVSARQRLLCVPDSPARQVLDAMADFVAIRSA
ncbi:MAG TPA: polyprenyl synthetase family protein [Planctomycetaceae bacterium]|jgi:octaprenyl-diphosphate synthase|nr:polyprenyl synthetase family protein [Planctomycetaceae bacterium]